MSTCEEMQCVKCSKSAYLRCPRCFDYYCTVECQMADWREHRKICCAMPTLINTSQSNESSKASLLAEKQRADNCSEVDQAFFNDTSNRDTKQSALMLRMNDPKPEISPLSCFKNLYIEDMLINECTDETCNSQSPEHLYNDQIISTKSDGLANKLNMNAKMSSSSITESNDRNPKEVAWKTFKMPSTDKNLEVIVQLVDREDPTVIWVTESRWESSLNNLMLVMNKSYNYKSPLANDVKAGDLVATPLFDKFYRSKVLRVDSVRSKAIVRFIDYGEMFWMRLSKLYAPTVMMKNICAYAFRVRIPRENVPLPLDVVINMSFVNFESANDGIFRVTIKSITSMGQRITMPPTPPETTKERNSPEYETPKKKQQEQKSEKFMLKDMKFIEVLDKKENIKMAVLDASNIRKGYIMAAYLATSSFAADYQRSYRAITNYCALFSKTRRGYAPIPNEMCLALYTTDDCWYRAVCLYVMKNDSFSVLFLDYGNTDVVPMKDIMSMPDELMNPCYTKKIYVKDIPMDRCDVFQKAVEKNPFIRCDFVESDNGQMAARIRKLEELIGK